MATANEPSVSNTVDFYVKLGMPREKIVLGLAAYGRSWTLNSVKSNQIGSPASGPGSAGKVIESIETRF